MEDWINGRIVQENEDGYLVQIPKIGEIQELGIKECQVKLEAHGLITEEQRQKAWCLITDIAEATNRIGRFKDATHKEMKQKFCEENYIPKFSLSNCSRVMAARYIDFLVSYILKNDIPSSISVEDYDNTAEKTIYAAFMGDHCMICENDISRYYTKDNLDLEQVQPNELEMGDKFYFLCDKHGDYLERKGTKIFESVYILEPLNVSKSVLEKITKEK